VTVQFSSFHDCIAIFEDTGNPVPLNTDITNRIILISCENLTIPSGSEVIKEISFKVVGTTSFTAPVKIINTLDEIDFLNIGDQVLLGIENIPASATVNIIGNIECIDSC
jgi:hypothetical protein